MNIYFVCYFILLKKKLSFTKRLIYLYKHSFFFSFLVIGFNFLKLLLTLCLTSWVKPCYRVKGYIPSTTVITIAGYFQWKLISFLGQFQELIQSSVYRIVPYTMLSVTFLLFFFLFFVFGRNVQIISTEKNPVHKLHLNPRLGPK